MKSAEKSEKVVGPLGITVAPPIQVDCDAFSGSLAMLFKSVRDHRVDLMGVPLLPICEAYFAYLLANADRDLDSDASALVAISYLIERKAWALLPTTEIAEPETEFDLDGTPIEPHVHEYDTAIEALRLWHDDRDQMFFRAAGSESLYEIPYDLDEVTSGDLARALERLLKRAVPEKPEVLSRARRSLAEQMSIVAKSLPAEFATLDRIIVGEFTRTEAVWWFLALLELIRLGQARVRLAGEEVEFAAGGPDH